MDSITAAQSGDPRHGSRTAQRALLGVAAVGVIVPLLMMPAAAGASDAATVELSPIVAAWPDSFTVTATKSEPTYVEHITVTRDEDTLALEIVMTAQGTGAGGTSLALVEVGSDGTIDWPVGCTAVDCEDAAELRGFLSTAQLIAAEREGRLPETGTRRLLGAHEVVCVEDEELHPGSPSVLDLEPCFSITTGAVLGQYSPQVGAFVGATMSATTIVESAQPSARLLVRDPSSS